MPPAEFYRNRHFGNRCVLVANGPSLNAMDLSFLRNEIIIGLYHRYEYQGRPGEQRILDGPDPNHFCENYFGHGQKWDNPQLAESEFYYARAREAYEADGRRIIDATPGGSCSVFEKQDYKEIFALK